MALIWGPDVMIDEYGGKLLLRLGALSYSLYLVHVPLGARVGNLGNRFVEAPSAEFGLSLLALTLSVAFALAFRKLVEVPSAACAHSLFPAAG